MQRIWVVPHAAGERAKSLSEELGITQTVAEILVRRGLGERQAALEFLRPSMLSMASPFRFAAMPQALARLALARQRREKVLIYGDYDVDGVTSTALLYKVLVDLGFQTVAYIPNRLDEGYGLHQEAISRAAEAGVKVLITVDCGITACAEVDFARAHGIDVIITDHHEPGTDIPQALAALNPKTDPGFPSRDLAGVGVAFKLAQALLYRFGTLEDGVHTETELLDLVALGTVADVVPLTGENRVLVTYGLRQMAHTVHAGLAALLAECGLAGRAVEAWQVAFLLAPRINAAGRLDSAKAALELFLTGRADRAAELARYLSQENAARQETEKKILAEAVARLEAAPLPRVIVLSAPDWHHGVIGIVASRLVERYYRPAFLLAEEGKTAKGSARGIPGYHVLAQLSAQAGLLARYGGHRQAAGFAMATADIPRLREGLNAAAAQLPADLFVETLPVDCETTLPALSAELYRELQALAPYGSGNPGPLLAARALPVYDVTQVGKEGSHLKFYLGTQGEFEAVAFRQGERLDELRGVGAIDAVFSLGENTYQGQTRLQLVLRDFAPHAVWRDEHLRQEFEQAAQEASLPASLSAAASEDAYSGSLLPRARLVEVYRELRQLAAVRNPFTLETSDPALREALKIFEEIGLIRCLGGTDRLVLELLPVRRKLNLEASLRYRTGQRRLNVVGERQDYI